MLEADHPLHEGQAANGRAVELDRTGRAAGGRIDRQTILERIEDPPTDAVVRQDRIA
jgi:hypothetical protein